MAYRLNVVAFRALLVPGSSADKGDSWFYTHTRSTRME